LKKLYEESQQKIKELKAEVSSTRCCICRTFLSALPCKRHVSCNIRLCEWFYGDSKISLCPVIFFQSQKLRDENLILKKNISSLYLTAREEIKRKDAQIKTLQDREVRSRRKYAASQQ